MSEWRRHPAMARGWPSFSPRAWRKSSQWFAVTRQHARLFLEDTVVDAVFRRVCYDRGWDDELKVFAGWACVREPLCCLRG